MDSFLETEMLDALRNKLASLKKERSTERLFQEIHTATETCGYSALTELLPELGLFPAVVLTAGNPKFRHGKNTCEIPIDLFVIDQVSDQEDSAKSFKVLRSAKKALNADPSGHLLRIGDNRYQLQDIENMMLDDQHIAWCLKVSGMSTC